MQRAPHPVTLRQLQYVVAVADHRSFRKAADACHVAQPSLSAQVAQVEGALGVRLFERDKRTVTITRAGAAVVERARALLVSADDFCAAARAFGDPFSGVLKIGVIPTIGPYLLPEVAPLLRQRFPRLTILWVEEKTRTLLAQLEDADVDAAVVAVESDAVGDLPRVVIGKDPFVFAAPPAHPLAKAKSHIRPGDLAGQPVLLLDDGHCFREQALAVCAAGGAVEAGYRATSLQTLVQMAAGGAGVTLLPRLALAVENRQGTLRLREFAARAPARTLGLVWRPTAGDVALQAIGAALREGYTALVER